MENRGLHHKQGHHRGFTLVELMVTMTILVILLAIGVPSMQQFLADRRAYAQADELVSTLRFARSEALKRAKPVTVCPSTTADSTAPSCAANATDWATGWLVFVDDLAPSRAIDVDREPLLKVQQPFPGASINGEGLPHKSITFEANGLVAGDEGHVTITPTSGKRRCVILSSTGRARVELKQLTEKC